MSINMYFVNKEKEKNSGIDIYAFYPLYQKITKLEGYLPQELSNHFKNLILIINDINNNATNDKSKKLFDTLINPSDVENRDITISEILNIRK